MSSIAIRDARLDDLRALADVNARSFTGTLGASLGERYQSAFLGYFLRRPDALCVIAEEGSRLAGLVYGAPDGYDEALKRELFLVTATSFLRHPQAILHRNFLPHLARRVRARLGREQHDRPESPKPVFDLVGIATSPDHRGRGVARKLLDAFTERAFEASFRSVVLDVYATNERAVKVYESNGWRVLWSEGNVRRYVKLQAL
jgi:ribosomal protein S18 acetylase RimI-like enzyme